MSGESRRNASGADSGYAVGIGEKLYGLLLYAYPRSFRELYAADMVSYLRDQRANATAPHGQPSALRSLALGKKIAVDLFRSVPREHIEARRRRAHPAGSATQPPKSSPGDGWMGQFLNDIAVAVRGLSKRPAFALTVILTLGLGIGANTAVFSLVSGVMLAPLPYPDADELVHVLQHSSSTNIFPMSVADFQGIQRSQRSLQGFAGLARGSATVTGVETPRQVDAIYVTSSFFEVLELEPAAGRGFLDGEDAAGAELVVVLSHAFKERQFGADADAIGKTVTLDASPHTVIGVMAPGVDALAGYPAELWPILQLQEPSRRGPFFVIGVGRVAEGVSVDDATADMARISAELFPLWSSSFQDETVVLTTLSLRQRVVGDAGNSLAIVFAAVAFVLLVAVANVANLMMARATDRYREMAVRSALGAGRGRLARWLIAESLVLAALGGALGLVIAFAGVEVFRRASFGLPRLQEVAVDGSAVAFTAAVVLCSGVFFGAVPLLFGRAQPADALKATTRAASAGGRAGFFRNALVAAEFALTLPLLAAAGLLVGSLAELRAVDPGFDPEGVITVAISLPSTTYGDRERRQGFWTSAVAAVREIPGVLDVAVARGLPPDPPSEYNNFDLFDRPVGEGRSQPVSPWSYVTADYFRTLRVPVLEGRAFDDAIDDADGLAVVVVSRTWADRFFPGETALGKQFVSGGCTECDPTTIVGVVGDMNYRGIGGDAEAIYQPVRQSWPGTMSLVVRSEAPWQTALPAITSRIRALDPDLPLDDAATMEARMYASRAQPRHWATLLTVFAVAALALATVGIFGVLSYFVRRQKLEIGVRMALGASPASVLGLVLRRGMMQAGIGVAAGLAITVYAMRWLESMLFGVTATDPAILGGVAGLLLLVAALACYLPGRRATQIDPVGAIAAD